MDIQHILRKLPHRYPFLLVDRVLEFEKKRLNVEFALEALSDGLEVPGIPR